MESLFSEGLVVGFGFFLCAFALAHILARLVLPVGGSANRFRALDGLRGMLALSVVLHHSWLWTAVTRFGQPWAAPSQNLPNQLGAGAVGMFFMATGFLFYPYMKTALAETNWADFAVRRLFRILPLVAFSTALVVAIIVWRTGGGISTNDVVPIATWISSIKEPPIAGYVDSGRINAHVLWSLRWEWLFYFVVLPLGAVVAGSVRRMGGADWATPFGMLLGLLMMRVVLAMGGHDWQALRFLPLFLVGMLAHEAQARQRIAQHLRSRVATCLAVACLGAGMLLANTPYGLALPLFAFFFICVACGNDMGGLLATPAARVLGECSFGIYLLHGLVLDVLFTEVGFWDASRVSLRTLGLGIVGLPVVILPVAMTGLLLIERPFIRLGRRVGAFFRA